MFVHQTSFSWCILARSEASVTPPVITISDYRIYHSYVSYSK